MDSGPPGHLLGRFRVTGCRSSGRVEVLDALDTTVQPERGGEAGSAVRSESSAVRLVSLPVFTAADASVHDPRPGVNLGELLERHGRYAMGCEGVLRPITAGFTASALHSADGERPSARLVIAYAAPSAGLDDELRDGAAAPGRVAEVVRAVAMILRRLHDQGVAHGCIRPELIGVESEVGWLGGFGVAPLAHAVDGTRLVAAAVPRGYQAPEQQEPSPGLPQLWTDTYSLGVVASVLLAGVNPSDEPVPTPRALGAAVSDRVEASVRAALSRSPAGRPGDLTGWAEDLADALRSSATRSAPPVQVGGSAQVFRAPTDEARAAEREPASLESSAPVEPAARLAEETAPLPGQQTIDTARVVPEPDRSTSAGLRVLIGLLLLGGVLGLGATVVVGFMVAMQAPPPTTGAGGAAVIPPTPTAWVAPSPVDAGAVPEASQLNDAGMPDAAEPDSGSPDALAPPGTTGTAHHAFSVRDTRAGIPVDGQVPIWGTADAVVTIVVFGDLECEHTRRAHAVMTELRTEYPNQLRVAWRNRPLASHRRAADAAVVAVSLFEQLGHQAFFRFWRAAGRRPEAAVDLEAWATEAGAGPGRVQRWLRQPTEPRALTRDLQIAGRFNVRATPTFFVNGARIEGYQPVENLAPMVERELEASRAALARGIPAEDLYRVRVNRNLINVGPED